jgi:hypothetical protein
VLSCSAAILAADRQKLHLPSCPNSPSQLSRQTQYYTNAGAYLGLIERKQSREQGVTYSLTEKGFRIMAKKFRARNLSLVEAVLQHGVFNQALQLYMQQGGRPLREHVEAIMRAANLEGLGRETSTIPRRAQTVLSWMVRAPERKSLTEAAG